MDAKLKRINRHYETVDKKVSSNHLTFAKKGNSTMYVPSRLNVVDPAFEELFEDGLINPNGWFLDYGGDGRVVALIASKYKVPSILIEHNERISEIAQQSIDGLCQKEAIDGVPVKIVHGDFLKDKTFKTAGVDFVDIMTHYSFYTEEDAIAERIRNKSAKGTILLYYSINQGEIAEKDFHGLKWVKTVDTKVFYFIENSALILPMHVYRK